MSQSHKVFMIGWEYPPHNSGGLGVACEGLTQALWEQNTHIYFTLPYGLPQAVSHMDVLVCQNEELLAATGGQAVPPFPAYLSASIRQNKISFDPKNLRALSNNELSRRVDAYADAIYSQAKSLSHQTDVVHAHDWMTYPAAALLKKKLNKPMIAHIHSTEFDRVPGAMGNQFIAHTEYEGLHAADTIIAVSEFTKKVLIDRYQVDPNKVEVIHNGLSEAPQVESLKFAAGRPVVVFMGRLTMQKGAEYFLDLAQKVLKDIPEALFIVAGHGDQYNMLLLENARKQLSASLLFAGFLRGQQKDFLLKRADVFVMPSVSEPFGLVALEAIQHDTPVIVSKTSGVREVLPGALSIDFWDTNLMSQTIGKLLKDPHYYHEVLSEQLKNVADVTWEHAAEKVKKVYERILKNR